MMRVPRQWKRLFRLRRWDPEADVDAELRFHLEERAAELVARGATRADARARAAAEFGDVGTVRAGLIEIDRRLAVRGRRADWWESIVQDVRYAVRNLRRAPAFSLAIVLTLGLGIGANAAMFSIVDRMLFRAPPLLRNPSLMHRVYLAQTDRNHRTVVNALPYALYVDLSKETASFARTAEAEEEDMAVGVGADARERRVNVVSASFFGFFDAQPVLGRFFNAADDTPPEGRAVVVLSYGFWQTRYGGRADVLDSTVQIGSGLFRVIGVAPARFVGLWPNQPPVAFIPVAHWASISDESWDMRLTWPTNYSWTFAEMIAERRPGVNLAAANVALANATGRSYQAELAKHSQSSPILYHPRAFAASILSERGPNESAFAMVAAWVSGVTIIVLLIACANVANLLLARAIGRRREIAVRLALGISRARLLSQLLTESLLLASLGGIAGVLFAQWGGALLQARFLPGDSPSSVLHDPRTLLFAGSAAIGAGLLTGLLPALQTRRADLTADLKAGAREGTYRRSRMRTTLLLLQGVLSMVLLVDAGLFVRSLRHVRDVPLGYDAKPVLGIALNMRGTKLDSAHQVLLRERLLDAARGVSGVEHASRAVMMPFTGTQSTSLYVADIDSVARLGEFDYNVVSPDYFATMGTRILRGRGITAQDAKNAPRAMVVSEAMAKALWPGKDAMGRCVRVNVATTPCAYVVGIAENIKAQQLSGDPGLMYYLSSAQFVPQQGIVLVRVRGDAEDAAEAVRRALQREMPGTSYITVVPLSLVLGEQTRSWELGAAMFTAFGVLAIVLAAIGLYSVTAYSVAQRTHELGVRITLGAQLKDVVRLVVMEGVTIAGSGIVIGSAIAFAVGPLLAPLLFDESPRDPEVFGAVAAVLIMAALLATLIPASRAVRVDPVEALRAE
jgi:predicted permease